MDITATGVDFIALYRAIDGIRPLGSMYAQFVTAIDGLGGISNWAAQADHTMNGAVPATLSARVLGNLGISAQTLGGSDPSASFTALNSALTTLFTVYPQSKFTVTINAINILQTLESDAVFGDVSKVFNARVAADFAIDTAPGADQEITPIQPVGLVPQVGIDLGY